MSNFSCADTIYVLYGSQTGQAQTIAEDIYQQCLDRHFDSKLLCLDQHDKKFNITQVKKAVFVISTTGDGDPPDNAGKFIRKLKRKSVPKDHLSNLSYALLGLGDTNYNNFCNCGKTLNGLLETLGASSFYPIGCADDAVGLEIVVEPWKDGLWDALQKDNVNISTTGSNDAISPISMDNQVKASEILSGSSNISNTEETYATGSPKDSLNNTIDRLSENTESMKIAPEQLLEQNAKELLAGMHEVIQLESKLKEYDATFPEDLKLPTLPMPYLNIEISETDQADTDMLDNTASCDYVNRCIGARTDIILANVQEAKYLTAENAIKKVLELVLCQNDESIDFLPGDSINVFCPNNEEEVNWIISRLGLIDIRNRTFTLRVMSETKKRLPKIPDHIPKDCTIKEALMFHCDIRSIPKKATLRMLAEYTENQNERKRLLQLSSREGGNDYTNLICNSSISFLDILATFPSCRPPFIKVIELLPRLQPRPYSIVNSPIQGKKIMKVAFTIVQLPPSIATRGLREGLCSGWLQSITKHLHSPQLSHGNNVGTVKIGISSRRNQNFNLPNDKSTPLIMIGAGTGISPYVGFLEHRWLIENDMAQTAHYGSWLLFYGCRHKDRDYLYKNDINTYLHRKILTHHYVAFSREVQENLSEKFPRYVQECLRQQSDKVVKLLLEESALVYVCGDAQGMAKDVMNTIIDLIERNKGIPKEEASKIVLTMMKEKRYRQDIWA
ncbi:Methionine synthase reductase [Trichoplax sp. H2]|nr:Methionine synthase reductase [Trichoplax sp. H2]|eukprot:RDD45610.1 Methionine synthase reductase [Trichoplax sp. H2]